MTPKQRRKRAKRKPSKCVKCSRKFRARKRARLVPEACTKPACQTWAAEQRKLNESITRLSAPETMFDLLGFDLGISSAAMASMGNSFRKMGKSLAFGAMYGMTGTRLRNLIPSSPPLSSSSPPLSSASVKKLIAARIGEAVPGAKIKNITMQTHEEIVYEIDIEAPPITEIEIKLCD